MESGATRVVSPFGSAFDIKAAALQIISRLEVTVGCGRVAFVQRRGERATSVKGWKGFKASGRRFQRTSLSLSTYTNVYKRIKRRNEKARKPVDAGIFNHADSTPANAWKLISGGHFADACFPLRREIAADKERGHFIHCEPARRKSRRERKSRELCAALVAISRKGPVASAFPQSRLIIPSLRRLFFARVSHRAIVVHRSPIKPSIALNSPRFHESTDHSFNRFFSRFSFATASGQSFRVHRTLPTKRDLSAGIKDT